jgi:hypothetical protein
MINKDHDALVFKKEHQGGLVCAKGSKLEFWLTCARNLEMLQELGLGEFHR